MIAKNCGGAVPDWREADGGAGRLAMLARADALVGRRARHMKSFALHLYLGAVFEVVAEANRYFANAEPWKLAKSDPARMRVVLFTTIETLRIAAILLQPVDAGVDGEAARPARRRRRGAQLSPQSTPATGPAQIGRRAPAQVGRAAAAPRRRYFRATSSRRPRRRDER